MSQTVKPVILIVEADYQMRTNYKTYLGAHFELLLAVNPGVARPSFLGHRDRIVAIVVTEDARDPSNALVLVSWFREEKFRKMIVGASRDTINRRRFRDEVDCTVAEEPKDVIAVLRNYLRPNTEPTTSTRRPSASHPVVQHEASL